MHRRSRPTHDLRLKIAIIESRRTQRWLSVETRIAENRLSAIVGHRSTPPTPAERERILRDLNRTRATRALPALTPLDLWTPDELDLDLVPVPDDAQGAA